MSRKAGLLPAQSEPDHDPDPAIVSLSESAGLLDALGSRTARAILTTLSEEPMAVSDVAEAVDTSLQNAAYHVNNLQNAGLIEVVDTWYSTKGAEMAVYAATYEPLVISLGEDADEALADAIRKPDPRADALVARD